MVIAAIQEGNAAFAAGRYSEARRSYVRAVLLDEEDGVAKLLYAIASLAEGDVSVASTALRRALAVTPELIDHPFNVASIYGSSERFNNQLGILARHVAANPQDREAALLLAYLHYASGGAEQARVLLGALADSDPTDDLPFLLRDAAERALMVPKRPLSEPSPPADELVP